MKAISKQTQPQWLFFVLLFFTLASFLGVNQYKYGLWNHYNTLPFLKDFLNPALYPEDPLVEQRQYFFTYFFDLLEWLLHLTNGSIPWLFTLLYLLSIFFTFWGIYRIAFQLFEQHSIAFSALVLFAFTFPTIGYVQSWESLFYERTLTLPFLLFSIYYMLRGKTLYAATLQGLAFILHPLSAVYVIGATWLGHFFRNKQIQFSDIRSLFWLLMLISPVLYLKMNAGTGEGLFYSDPKWLEIMRLRNYHHAFPFTFDLDLFLKSAATLFAFFLLWNSLSPASATKRFLLGFAGAILIFLIIGTVFTEIIPLKIVIQFQFFRSFRFLIYLAIILWAGAIQRSSIGVLALSSILLLSNYYDGQISKFAGFAGIFFLLLVFMRFTNIALQKRVAALTLAYVLLGTAAYFTRGDFTIHNQQPEKWLEVQNWAKTESDQNSLFIVPPQEWGFRCESERSIYGDWDDGTKAFFNAAYAKEWMHRMEMLGCSNPDQLVADYKSIDLKKLGAIQQTQKDKYTDIYVVAYADQKLPLPQFYSNETYKVYLLSKVDK